MFDYTLTQVEVWADDASNFRIRCVGEDVHDEHDILVLLKHFNLKGNNLSIMAHLFYKSIVKFA